MYRRYTRDIGSRSKIDSSRNPRFSPADDKFSRAAITVRLTLGLTNDGKESLRNIDSRRVFFYVLGRYFIAEKVFQE